MLEGESVKHFCVPQNIAPILAIEGGQLKVYNVFTGNGNERTDHCYLGDQAKNSFLLHCVAAMIALQQSKTGSISMDVDLDVHQNVHQKMHPRALIVIVIEHSKGMFQGDNSA